MSDDHESVCPNHPERAAVDRCFTCMKPVCAECVIEVREHAFCSKECANNHFVTQMNLDADGARHAAERRRRRIRRLVYLGLLLALAACGWGAWHLALTERHRQAVRERLRPLLRGDSGQNQRR